MAWKHGVSPSSLQSLTHRPPNTITLYLQLRHSHTERRTCYLIYAHMLDNCTYIIFDDRKGHFDLANIAHMDNRRKPLDLIDGFLGIGDRGGGDDSGISGLYRA